MRTKTFAGASLLGAAALVAASYAGPRGAGGWTMWAVLCVAVIAFAVGYPRLIGLPAPLPVTIVIALAGIGSGTTAAMAPMPTPLQWMGAFGAIGVILVFLTQLLRGTGQRLRLESTLGGAAGVLVAILGSGWVGADRLAPNANDGSMMLISGLSLAGAVLVSVIKWPERITAPLAIVAAVLIGGVSSALVEDVAALPAAVVGAVVGIVVVCLHMMLVSEAFVLRGGAIISSAPGVPGATRQPGPPAADSDDGDAAAGAAAAAGAPHPAPRPGPAPVSARAAATAGGASHAVDAAAPGPGATAPLLDAWGAVAAGIASVISSGALVYYVERLLLR